MLSWSVFIYPIFLDLLKFYTILLLEMETEPTFLSMFIDFIIGTLIVVIGTGVFGFLCILVDGFIKKGIKEMSPFDSGWSGGGD